MLFQTGKTSLEHKLRYFWSNLRALYESNLWPTVDSNATAIPQVQKHSKDMGKIVHVTSVVQP